MTDTPIAALASRIGQTLGTTGWHVVEQARIAAFAAATGDDQWIHLDAERAARESPFGATVAQGYLTLSMLPMLMRAAGLDFEAHATALNYGLDRVRFLAPVRAGDRVRLTVTLSRIEPRGADLMLALRNTVEVEGAPKPALVADTLVLLLGAAG